MKLLKTVFAFGVKLTSRRPVSMPRIQRAIINVVATIYLVTAVTVTPVHAEDPPLGNPWIRHNGPSQSKGVIVFVHGVLGNSKSTWSSSKAFWPELITRDHAFDGQDVYVYGYPSPLRGRTLSTDDVADNLRLVLNDDGVLGYKTIIIVSHSMGGLVTRAFLLKYRYVVPKIKLLYFFGTPTTGSPYAKLAAVISKNRQFEQMYPMETDSYVAPLQSAWLAAKMELKSYCGFETQTLYGQIIVERQSATNLCTERLDPIDENHIDMVKPLNVTSTAYRALKGALLDADAQAEAAEARLAVKKIIPTTETYRADVASGHCKDFGAWQTVASESKPDTWTIVSSDFRVEGAARSCGAWTECNQTVSTPRKVVWTFRTQGHDEECGHSGNTGIHNSTGILTVYWQHPE